MKTEFFNDVYEVVKLIPYGRVTSYGAIATYLGSRQSARMVGWAMNACPKVLPAHRVLNRDGLLTGKGHFNPPESMQQRLEAEGITIEENQVQNFEQVFWNPSEALL